MERHRCRSILADEAIVTEKRWAARRVEAEHRHALPRRERLVDGRLDRMRHGELERVVRRDAGVRLEYLIVAVVGVVLDDLVARVRAVRTELVEIAARRCVEIELPRIRR